MRRFALPLLLMTSLAFNLCFVGGYLYVRDIVRQLGTPEGRVELVGRRIGADPELRRVCAAIERERVDARKRILDEEKKGIDTFFAEAVKDEPDMERLRAMVDAGMELHHRLLLNDLEHLMRIVSKLDPKQRRTMAAIIQQEDLFAE